MNASEKSGTDFAVLAGHWVPQKPTQWGVDGSAWLGPRHQGLHLPEFTISVGGGGGGVGSSLFAKPPRT
jgi:hypothetical protein